jgi:hypothetical protein
MKIKSKVIIGVTVIGSVIGVLAWATPIINLASPILATGDQNQYRNAWGIRNYRWRVQSLPEDRGTLIDSHSGCVLF